MVAKALGVKLELQQVTGANRIPFLLTDKVDIVISVMGLTPEARQADHVHLALRRHQTSRCSGPRAPKREVGRRHRQPSRSQAAKGTTQEDGR